MLFTKHKYVFILVGCVVRGYLKQFSHRLLAYNIVILFFFNYYDLFYPAAESGLC